MKTEGFKDSQDAEFWHGKAVELAVNFLPSNAPLVKHIVTSYQKHHSPCMKSIKDKPVGCSDEISSDEEKSHYFVEKMEAFVRRFVVQTNHNSGHADD